MISAPARRDQLRERLGQEVFDLLIVGGGINGAAIARDASARGYSVALLEQNDFGFGTSGRSSRLVHGGLRYLEHGRVRLVFESVSERARLARIARHLVRPLPFVFPVYKGQRSMITMDIGLWVYDALALFRNYRTHRDLTPVEVAEVIPGIRAEGLNGAVLYYDYQTDDARLTLENVLAASASGAAALSYCPVEAIAPAGEGERVVRARDLLTGKTLEARARVLVLAAGPWTDALLGMVGDKEPWLRPTKGVHIVVPRARLPIGAALVMRHPSDDRVLFALPYHEHVVLGTTDTDFDGDPGEVNTTAEDVRYLVDAATHYFPEAGLTAPEVVASWVGIRPLVAQPGAADPSAVSREHRIEARPDGLVIIAGGKLTTYRRMAAECVDVAVELCSRRGGPAPRPHAPTHRMPLPGAEGLESDGDLDALASKLEAELHDSEAGAHLAHTYGARATRLVDLMTEDAGAAAPIVPGLPYRWAEVTFAAREDLALTVADVLLRRTQIFYRAMDQGLSVAEETAARLGRELCWDAAQVERQLEAYRELVAINRAWRSG